MSDGEGTHIRVTPDGAVRLNPNGKEIPITPANASFVSEKKIPSSGLRMNNAERVRQKNSQRNFTNNGRKKPTDD